MTDQVEKPALRKPEFVKIKDLERGRSGYNVYVKVVKVDERQVDTKDGQKIPMVDAVIADETGSAKAFFKGDNAKLVKEGAVLAIRNGVKKIIKGHISLELDLFGRITS
jgi:ssDNA-binding replication factor A large subunit